MPTIKNNEAQQAASDAAADPQRELDRKNQFSQRTSVSVRTVDNWLRERRIPFLKINRTVLIPWREALEQLKRNHQVNARGQ